MALVRRLATGAIGIQDVRIGRPGELLVGRGNKVEGREAVDDDKERRQHEAEEDATQSGPSLLRVFSIAHHRVARVNPDPRKRLPPRGAPVKRKWSDLPQAGSPARRLTRRREPPACPAPDSGVELDSTYTPERTRMRHGRKGLRAWPRQRPAVPNASGARRI